MIDRDQVLHVAKLARLRLSEDEVERMAGELSTILDHIETMNELDLEGVEPTSHVVELENVLRPDEPRPSWPASALEQAPDAADERLPGAEPGAHERELLHSPRPAGRAIAPGEAERRRAVRRLPRPRGGGRPGAFLWVAEETPEDAGGAAAARGEGPLLRRGRAERRRLAHPRGLPPALHGHGVGGSGRRARACSARPTRTSSRWARPTRTRATAR